MAKKLRAVRVTFRAGRKKIRVTFKRSKMTPAAKRARKARGRALARKWGFFKKKGCIYQKRPGKKAKLIRRL